MSGIINKNLLNKRKHNISFADILSIFNDKNALSIFDKERSQENEGRWITIGMSAFGKLYVVVHTYKEVNDDEKIRIISARKAVNKEVKMYYSDIEA